MSSDRYIYIEVKEDEGYVETEEKNFDSKHPEKDDNDSLKKAIKMIDDAKHLHTITS